MRRNTRKRKNKRSNRKPVEQRTYRSERVVRLPGIGFVDRVVQKYRYDEIPTNRFTTAVASGAVFYNASSMAALFNGGAVSEIPYWTQFSNAGNVCSGISNSYTRYRVIHSKITVRATSREAVNSQVLVLFPTVTAAYTGGAIDWVAISSAPGAKTCTLSPYVGGTSGKTLTASMYVERLFGPEYLEQDEYSGTIVNSTAANPTTMGYWGLAFYNPATNTVTTGGIVANVIITQTVEMFQPRRSETLSLVKTCSGCKLFASNKMMESDHGTFKCTCGKRFCRRISCEEML